MEFAVGVSQTDTEREKKSRLSVQRHGGRERRMISENGNSEGSLRTINVLGLYL